AHTAHPPDTQVADRLQALAAVLSDPARPSEAAGSALAELGRYAGSTRLALRALQDTFALAERSTRRLDLQLHDRATAALALLEAADWPRPHPAPLEELAAFYRAVAAQGRAPSPFPEEALRALGAGRAEIATCLACLRAAAPALELLADLDRALASQL